jgi:pyruvate dehydrogenase E2 component (dihydrolipoamide acetyltransferase)
MTSALKGEVTIREPTRAQQAIARRVAEAKATVPDVTVDAELEIDCAIAVRQELIADWGADEAPQIRDFILKACGLALREFPSVNASYRDGRFRLYSRVNIGITLAGDGVLSSPTILDADRKSLRQIARESRTLTGRVREGAISSAELAGATFTISDLGMHGISRFQPIITSPQAATLGIGAVRSVVYVEQARIQQREVLTASLTCDHRILYGADAAAFLDHVGALLAAPPEWTH